MTSLCLNMIVKNESKIILRLLNSVVDIIDSYVVCDTGSTDDTPILIKTFFQMKNKPGIVFHEPFVNFCHNRNVSLQKCKEVNADYILLLDADMILDVKTFTKDMLTCDSYKLTQGSEHFYY